MLHTFAVGVAMTSSKDHAASSASRSAPVAVFEMCTFGTWLTWLTFWDLRLRTTGLACYLVDVYSGAGRPQLWAPHIQA